ncbi:MAG: SIMPL domain-containing protein [Acidobacteriia bacterium]|nr:SIMPL domain-containing protein [Terriglobia bacterium]
MKSITLGTLLFLTLTSLLLTAQELQISRSSRTIYVSAEDSVKVDAELAEVHFGYLNFAPTEDQTFTDNARAADRIIKAILDSGVKEEEIETETMAVFRTNFSDKVPEATQQQRRFTARQMWRVRVPVAQAQGVINTAMNAGANVVDPVSWTVRDRNALQSKATAAAMIKAHRVAEQVAISLGIKLGALLYSSNFAGVASSRGYPAGVAGGMVGGIMGDENIPRPHIRLFPQKVEQEATAYAVYAIE